MIYVFGSTYQHSVLVLLQPLSLHEESAPGSRSTCSEFIVDSDMLQWYERQSFSHMMFLLYWL